MTLSVTRALAVVALGGCGGAAGPRAESGRALAPPVDAAPALARFECPAGSGAAVIDGAVLGRFRGGRCERAVLRWTETRGVDGECARDYAVDVVDPAGGDGRSVKLGTWPCPQWWYRCGPTPVCEHGATGGTRWRVDLAAAFPIEAGREGVIVRVEHPDGTLLSLFDIAGEPRWHFGDRRADYFAVGADRVEWIACEDAFAGVRVGRVFEGRLVDTDDSPRLGLSCAAPIGIERPGRARSIE